MFYDLLIKGGTVIDPAQGLHEKLDIGLSLGKVKAVSANISPSEARRVIHVENLIVTPGLIDVHCHCAYGIVDWAADPNEIGVTSGVTTLCDAGTTGWANFIGLRTFLIPQNRTDIFCFLSMATAGISVAFERQAILSWHDINPKGIQKTIDDNRDVIKGIKIQAVGAVAEELGIEAIKMAKKIASQNGLRLMVHVGNGPEEQVPQPVMDAFTRDLLSFLGEGDILVHPYTWKQGGVIKPDGSVFPGLREAIARGVLLDIAGGRPNWSFEIARIGIAQGVLPTTLSTDMSGFGVNQTVFDLTTTMSKFLAAGLTLDQVIEMTTINSARMLREEERRGSLKVGMPADISILELKRGNYIFDDGIAGKIFKGDLLITPRLTIKNGVEIQARSRFTQEG